MPRSPDGHCADTESTVDRNVLTSRTIDVQKISGDLIARFGAVLTVEVIKRCVTAAAMGFDDARIDTYLPVLVHTAARRELERMAKETSWTANG